MHRLLQAANFIETVEKRQGLKIACPEEIAYRRGYIDATQVERLAQPLLKTDYGQYLMTLLQQEGRYDGRAANPSSGGVSH